MSKSTGLLLTKLIATLVATWISFSLIANNILAFVLTLSVVVTVLNYLVGELFVLRNFGNLTATISDSGLAMITAYIVGSFAASFNANIISFITYGVLIAIIEYFLHMYILRTKEVAPNPNDDLFRSNRVNYNTEAGNEINPDINSSNTDNKINKQKTKN
ncbi:DUF2512 family protein [Clostridium cylindrosporum]|uniref:Integral membrane protein n=1 Tax=Clostridium cylindrosporum DSM 605 TaxID=1121307 RepID=A0A0J8D798_CLOCY|nr:DUF2512 family protein [Clostridium cylindrosporum]KMT21940.1 hypothetical protein CLCY_3c02110 [Clostridium cylindrosporum DSM 605]